MVIKEIHLMKLQFHGKLVHYDIIPYFQECYKEHVKRYKKYSKNEN